MCSRYTIIGLSLLIIPFIPASNIFFTVGFVLAERTLYIPSAGYCLLVIIGLHKLLTGTSLRNLLLLFYTFLCLTFFMRSWIRSGQWRNEDLLFTSALDVCPLNAKVHYNIARNADDAGNLNLAKLGYREALRYVFHLSSIFDENNNLILYYILIFIYFFFYIV